MCALMSHLAESEVNAELDWHLWALEIHHGLEAEREELHVVRVDAHCLAVHAHEAVQAATAKLSAES